MSTYDDRLAALERKVAALELRRMYDERKAEENTPSTQAFHLREINENMTILLGIASDQEEDIKTVKSDVGTLKERVEHGFAFMEQRFVSLEAKFDEHTALLAQILARLPEKP